MACGQPCEWAWLGTYWYPALACEIPGCECPYPPYDGEAFDERAYSNCVEVETSADSSSKTSVSDDCTGTCAWEWTWTGAEYCWSYIGPEGGCLGAPNCTCINRPAREGTFAGEIYIAVCGIGDVPINTCEGDYP